MTENEKTLRERRVEILMTGDGDNGMSEADARADAYMESVETIVQQDGDHLRKTNPELFDHNGEFTAMKLDNFTLAYIEAMLWSTNDESDESGGDPMDSNYSVDDIADSFLADIVADCAAFRREFSDEFIRAACLTRIDPIEQAGHDFWLTRAGHGVGFWETSDWSEEAGEAMTSYSTNAGEVWPYVGDDGKIYS
jgi:hypothetical protein